MKHTVEPAAGPGRVWPADPEQEQERDREEAEGEGGSRDPDSRDPDSRDPDRRDPGPRDPDPGPLDEGASELEASAAISTRSYALTGLFLIALVLALRFARELFLPVVLAVMLKFLLNPVARGLERLRIPAAVASFLVISAAVLALSLIVVRVYQPAQAWLGELPETLRRAQVKVAEIREPVEAMAEVARQVDEIAGDGEEGAEPSVELESASLSESFFAGVRSLAATAAVTVALLYFLLASGDLFLRKLVSVLTRLRDKKRAVEIARQVESDVSIYLLTITLINLALGGAVTLAMYWLHMPTPLLWGVMAASFNFVPYLGAAVGVAAIAVASFLNFEQLGPMVAPPLAYLALTSFEGTVVTPTILGQRLALNPVTVFLGLFFWGWLWGIPGALLAVPILVVLKIVFDRIPNLAAVGEFMGR